MRLHDIHRLAQVSVSAETVAGVTRHCIPPTDFHYERELLMESVLPQLQYCLRHYGLDLQIIDYHQHYGSSSSSTPLHHGLNRVLFDQHLQKIREMPKTSLASICVVSVL